MKTQSTFHKIFLFAAIAIANAFFFQSCSPENDVKPITPPSYMVTVKVTDISNGSSTIYAQAVKRFQIVSADQPQQAILDTTITGNCTYSFMSKTPNVTITATLTSSTDFVSSIEIDANGKMQAYHNGSCAGPEFDITDNISF